MMKCAPSSAGEVDRLERAADRLVAHRVVGRAESALAEERVEVQAARDAVDVVAAERRAHRVEVLGDELLRVVELVAVHQVAEALDGAARPCRPSARPPTAAGSRPGTNRVDHRPEGPDSQTRLHRSSLPVGGHRAAAETLIFRRFSATSLSSTNLLSAPAPSSARGVEVSGSADDTRYDRRVLTRAEIDAARRRAAEQPRTAPAIVLTPEERDAIEIADFGLSRTRAARARGRRVREHRTASARRSSCSSRARPAPSTGTRPSTAPPGKEETFRCRAGLVYLYVEGAPSAASRGPARRTAIRAAPSRSGARSCSGPASSTRSRTGHAALVPGRRRRARSSASSRRRAATSSTSSPTRAFERATVRSCTEDQTGRVRLSRSRGYSVSTSMPSAVTATVSEWRKPPTVAE